MPEKASVNEKIVEQMVELDGVPINYVKVGQGPKVILFLPGILGTWETDFGAALQEDFNRARFTMVCWDPPGFGKSRPYSRLRHKELHLEDAKNAHRLMQHLGLAADYNVVGWSEGGRAAFALAILYPQNVTRVVVMGSILDIDQNAVDYFSKTADFSIWSQEQLDLMTSIYGREYFTTLWLDSVEFMKNNVGKGINRQLLKDVKQPVLIMYGSYDLLMGDKTEYFKQLAEDIPNAKFLLKRGGNHSFHKNDRRWFKEKVEHFLYTNSYRNVGL